MSSAKYDDETLERLRTAINALADPPPRLKTAGEVIEALRSDLSRKQAVGWSWGQLAEALRQHGFLISGEALRGHLSRRRRAGSSRKKKPGSPVTVIRRSGDAAPASAPLPARVESTRHAGFNEEG